MFTLCRTCVVEGSSSCYHDVHDRVLQGVWCTDEIKKAISLGYQIMNITEVWHFEEVEQYNPESQQGGLFTGYINTFLKLKQEASGWPGWCQTDADKQEYISSYNA